MTQFTHGRLSQAASEEELFTDRITFLDTDWYCSTMYIYDTGMLTLLLLVGYRPVTLQGLPKEDASGDTPLISHVHWQVPVQFAFCDFLTASLEVSFFFVRAQIPQ